MVLKPYYEEPDEDQEEDRNEEDKGRSDSLTVKLLKTRSVLISDVITKKLAERVSQQLLLLDAESADPIKVFINSPGGDADAGFAIFDMLRFVRSPIKTVAVGLTASAGSIILLAAPKGSRYALPNARILIHQPSSAFQGDATDVDIQAREILRLKERGNRLMAEETGQSYEQVAMDTERDKWMYADEAKEYGLVDHIITRGEELE
ncbi:ATP-dependent Clp protease proteolytic subunit [bacterium]|nr:ATP-dependent Clp protease proteolytic subunit [candidate division CSSED10-310 bacterium]